MERENALNTNAVRDLPNAEVTIQTPWVFHGNACSLERLNTSLLAFFDSYANFNSVTGFEFGELCCIWVRMLFFNNINQIHKILSYETSIRLTVGPEGRKKLRWHQNVAEYFYSSG